MLLLLEPLEPNNGEFEESDSDEGQAEHSETPVKNKDEDPSGNDADSCFPTSAHVETIEQIGCQRGS